MADATESNPPSGAQKMFGDFAPALVDFTDDIVFGQVWKRPELSPKDRSLVTVASLTTSHRSDHPPCLLCRLAQGHVRDGRSQASLPRQLRP
jgi:alkylhydroperoxidase/carboxymuconolactone decarboxylase family protein YurZ